MLISLEVQNYALIDSAGIEFDKGLTIITGETGAGKSILLGALGLLLGDRADTGALFDKKRKCVVEGRFRIDNYGLEDLFESNDLDYSSETIIRREVTAEGKSRAFVNDTPVNLSLLKSIGRRLVDVHSQHETLTLGSSEFQLDILDAASGNGKLRMEYKRAFMDYRSSFALLSQLQEEEAQSRKDLDYFQFQFEELDALNLKPGEQEEQETELVALENAETIKTGLLKVHRSLSGEEESLIRRLQESRQQLQQLAKFHPKVAELSERMNSMIIELKDIASETEGLEEDIVFDPEKIQKLQERLDDIYRLQQKHSVKTVDDLLLVYGQLEEKIRGVNSLEERIAAEKERTEKLYREVMKVGEKLSAGRSKAIPLLTGELKELLSELGMPDSNMIIELSGTEKPGELGLDKAEFLFSANKGALPQLLSKVASGGELSRVMLALKAILSRTSKLPTIVFDEIDTGISGDIAARAGGIMKKMGTQMQVVTITHLPQVASKGDAHLFVYKEDAGDRTVSRIRKLTDKERVEELAKMLSAGRPGQAARRNAEELLQA